MSQSIKLHQALHGYSDGHQLLASSMKLSSEQESQLLIMSDLSGPSTYADFDSYLTAYPLEGSGFYCFARTWYAPEMPRPGCVWTHTLIIPDAELAHVPDMHALLALFSRPKNDFEVDEYSHTLELVCASTSGSLMLHPITKQLLQRLYSSKLAVVISSSNAIELESCVIGVFSQQWPRLRRNFRFCTGALSLREDDFDLCISPAEIARSAPNNFQVFESLTSSSKEIVVDEDWVEVACNDIGAGSSAFRQFLWRHGPDFSDGRAAYKPLSEIYLVLPELSTHSNVEHALSAVGYFFPEPDSAIRLKKELFEQSGRYCEGFGGESSVLRALVTHPAADAISSEVANVKTRAISLASTDLESATNIAFTALELGGQHASQFIAGYLDAFTAQDIAVHDIPLQISLKLITRNPKLALLPEFWRRSVSEQVSLFWYIAGQSFSELESHKLVPAMAEGAAWKALSLAVENKGLEAIRSLADWLDLRSTKSISIPKPLWTILSSKTEDFITLLEQNSLGPVSIKIVSALADPRSWRVRLLGSEPWLQHLESDAVLENANYELMSRVFILAIGLHSKNSSLISMSFSQVYSAAKQSQIERAGWERLEHFLTWYSPEWDRCARLIRTVVNICVAKSWPLEDAVSIFNNDEQFARAMHEAAQSWSGKTYIRKLYDYHRNQIDHHKQMEVLRLYYK